jgi:hypothetical protein
MRVTPLCCAPTPLQGNWLAVTGIGIAQIFNCFRVALFCGVDQSLMCRVFFGLSLQFPKFFNRGSVWCLLGVSWGVDPRTCSDG